MTQAAGGHHDDALLVEHITTPFMSEKEQCFVGGIGHTPGYTPAAGGSLRQETCLSNRTEREVAGEKGEDGARERMVQLFPHCPSQPRREVGRFRIPRWW